MSQDRGLKSTAKSINLFWSMTLWQDIISKVQYGCLLHGAQTAINVLVDDLESSKGAFSCCKFWQKNTVALFVCIW